METSMSIIRTLASGVAGRTVARRLARVIPNPLLRYAVVTAATAVAPMIARRFSEKMQQRKLARRDARIRTDRRLALAD
jgi:hypothetical protein